MEESEALRSRVRLIAPDIIFVEQMPVPAPYTAALAMDRVAELGESSAGYHLIVDSTGSTRPSAATRRVVRERLPRLVALKTLTFVVGENWRLRFEMRFAAAALGFEKVDVVTTVEEALERLGRRSG